MSSDPRFAASLSELSEQFSRISTADCNLDLFSDRLLKAQIDDGKSTNMIILRRVHDHQVPNVVFKCQIFRFLCHKESIARESQGFREMFSFAPDCQEFEIQHDRPQIVSQFLYYVGTSQFDDHQLSLHDWDDLLSLADQFKFPLMARVCEHYLCSSLTGVNAVDTLHFAIAHEMALLQNFTIDFMRKNWNEFNNCPLLSELAHIYPHLSGLDSCSF